MGLNDTTLTQLKAFANRITSYVNDDSARVNDYSAKVYVDFAALDAALPHIIVSKGIGASDPEVGDLREQGEIDVVIRGRARADEPNVSALADLVIQALVSYREPGTSENGLLSVTSYRRGRIEFADSGTGDEVIELPLVFEFFAWPPLLSDALT